MKFRLLLGDSLKKLKDLEDNSIDAVVTDPPYGLAFMGKKWDYDVPSVDLWREVLRVLKPGGHLLSFGGTRTYHRMVVNIEDAGFEIRDQIQWLYGSGFPKSHDISKAIDKQAGAERKVVGENPNNRDRSKHNYNSVGNVGSDAVLTAPSTQDAIKWQGWGTALKPANEPIVLARKPLEKGLTIAENVLKYGVGGLNIDGTRVETETIKVDHKKGNSNSLNYKDKGEKPPEFSHSTFHTGRFPANLILDDIAAEMLGEPSRFFYVAKASKSERNRGLEGMPTKHVGTYAQDEWSRKNMGNTPDEKRDPVQNFHPTVKPIKLMEYLIKLVTPPQGKVLDPFMGSGTTGVACRKLKCRFIGIDNEKEYFKIAKQRIVKG